MRFNQRNNLLQTYCLVLLFFFGSCDNDSSTPKVSSQIKNHDESLTLRLTAFDYIPDQVKDCNCLFASDKNKFSEKKFIYVSDFLVTSFASINGVMTKFIMMSYDYQNSKTSTAIYKNSGYEMKVEIKHEVKDSKKGKKSGKITITAKDGRSLVRYFYGECGC